MIVATNEGDSYSKLVQRVGDMPPDVVIVDSESDISAEAIGRSRLAKLGPVCGARLAYVTTTAAEEQIEAAKMYLEFLQSHCDGEKH